MDLDKVGKFIAENRNLQNLTQKDLGELLGVNPKTISKWERGVNAPDIAVLTELAKYLNVSVEEILAGERIKKDKLTKQLINKIFNKSNKRFIVISITFIILAIFLIVILAIYKHNFYKPKPEVYTISTDNEEYQVTGYLLLNKNDYSVNITEIKNAEVEESRMSDIKFDFLEINFVSDGEILFNYSIKDSGEFYLYEELKKADIEFSRKSENAKLILDATNKIVIKYCENDIECSTIKLNLKMEESE